MRNKVLQKSILNILNRVDDVFLRETTLAAEAEIAVDRPLTTGEFADELRYLEDRELIEKDHTLLDDRMWHITAKGRLALKGL